MWSTSGYTSNSWANVYELTSRGFIGFIMFVSHSYSWAPRIRDQITVFQHWWTITQPFPFDCKQVFLSLQPRQNNSEARRGKSERFRTNTSAFNFGVLGHTGEAAALVSAVKHSRFSSSLMSITLRSVNEHENVSATDQTSDIKTNCYQ